MTHIYAIAGRPSARHQSHASRSGPNDRIDPSAAPRTRSFYRHALPVRLTHWVNVVCLTIMLMSGLAIFNAHPALYWGERSAFDHPILEMTAQQNRKGQKAGVTTILGHPFTTTGVLGLSDEFGSPTERGFPAWATLPGPQWLAMARRWHFFFAWIFLLNGLAYAAYALFSRRLWRDLIPSWQQLRHIGGSVWDHLRLRFPKGEEARRYNVLQKLSYIVVVFGLGPLMVLAGLTLSPHMDAVAPWLLDMFGGRQSARTIHFITAFAFLAFVLIHILMVVVSGVWNNLRSILTGWYAIQEPAKGQVDAKSD